MIALDQIVALAKRRGFLYQGSEIYGGLAGTWDWGPLGVALKNKLKAHWWRSFVESRDDIYGLDAAIIMNPRVWEASGHVAGFADPLGNGTQFNTMFKTSIGTGDEAAVAYLRPETAQGIFVNFKNIIDSCHPRLPFGIAQIGKAFRNEIAPRDFIFRAREFEQLEVEYFVRSDPPAGGWERHFEVWRAETKKWVLDLGLDATRLHELEVPENERAHYSKRTIDFEFDFPFGRKELFGLAYRGDFDLRNHAAASGVPLEYFDDETKERFVPHVIEPSFGLDRIVLALFCSAYAEDDLGGERRTVLKFKPELAPVRAAIFPLLKNKPELVTKAREIYAKLKPLIPSLQFDDNGNIGKRYRRQDEIGTPHCLTIDFQTLDDDTVTLRERDSGEQRRVHVTDLPSEPLAIAVK